MSRLKLKMSTVVLLSVGVCSMAAVGPLASSAAAASPKITVTCAASDCTVAGSGFTPDGEWKRKEYAGTAVLASYSFWASGGGYVGGKEVCTKVGEIDGRPLSYCRHVGGTKYPGGEFTDAFSREDASLACDTTAAGTVQYTDVASGLTASQPFTWVGPPCSTTTTLSIPSTVSTAWTATAVNPASVNAGSTVVMSGTITITVNGAFFCYYTAGASSGCSLASLPVGTDQLHASYFGNAAYGPSSASTVVTVFVKSTAGSSEIWAGYVDTAGTYSAVSASWVVPKANCGFLEDAQSSTWVGLDGNGQGLPLEQIGTDSNCITGQGRYWAWSQMVPSGPQCIDWCSLLNGFVGGDTVKPGDLMTASVTATGTPGLFTLTIADSNQGWSYSATESNPGAPTASAECIEEQPAVLAFPLTNFGSVTFKQCMATGSNGLATPVWDHTNEADEMTKNKVVKAVVSPLSDDGSEFTVTWRHG